MVREAYDVAICEFLLLEISLVWYPKPRIVFPFFLQIKAPSSQPEWKNKKEKKKAGEETFFCGRQEEHAILISRLLLRMRCMYVSSIRLDFH